MAHMHILLVSCKGKIFHCTTVLIKFTSLPQVPSWIESQLTTAKSLGLWPTRSGLWCEPGAEQSQTNLNTSDPQFTHLWKWSSWIGWLSRSLLVKFLVPEAGTKNMFDQVFHTLLRSPVRLYFLLVDECSLRKYVAGASLLGCFATLSLWKKKSISDLYLLSAS